MPPTDTATLHTAPSDTAPSTVVPQLFCVLESGCPSRRVSSHALEDIDEIRFVRAPQGTDHERSHRDRTARQLTIQIADRWLSSEHAEIARRGDHYVFRDLRSKNGSRINGVQVDSATLGDGDLIEIGQTFCLFRAFSQLSESEPRDAVTSAEQVVAGLGTLHPVLNARFVDLGRIATTDVPVTILGETGTGKEVLARAVHTMSRRPGELVAVNCGAIPKDLVASELFGHAKGAFTGATSDKLGLIRSADRGTLFLDEIGELPLEQQVVLLRVLQDRSVTPIGGTARKVDFRLVVATNRDMSAALVGGQFREDLWARVTGFVVRLPSLRERREDIGLILGSLLARLRAPDAPRVTIRSDAAYALLRYKWPHNIRELEQCLRSALALCQSDTVTLANLPEAIRSEPMSQPPSSSPSYGDPAAALDELREDHLRKLFERAAGNVSEVARLMGKSRTQIQRWIKRYGIDPEAYRKL